MKKNFGFVRPKVLPEHYTFGAFSLNRVILQPDGQWDAFLPTYEPQFNSRYDSFGCTVWGWQNWIEIMVKKLLNREDNYSERFTYILANIAPPGADPHYVAEIIRANGLIDDSELPMTPEYADFVKPKPMTPKYMTSARKWLDRFDFKHEWLISNATHRKNRVALIKDALKYSPVCVSLTAWYKDGEIYVDRGQPNTHWTVVYGWNDEKKAWKVFDSYDQSTKLYSFDSAIDFAKRGSLEPKQIDEQKFSLMTLILEASRWLSKLLKASEPIPAVNPTPEPPQPQPEPTGSLLIEWATAIRDFEGKPGDLNYKNNNPGNIRSVQGPFLKFKTWEEGWNALLDYLTTPATGRHKA
jgi:hypothetical protein